MKILHFFHDEEIIESVKRIVRKKGLEYYAVSLDSDLIQPLDDAYGDCDLILFECKNTKSVFEKILKNMLADAQKHISTIIITDETDIDSKKYFYNLGISAVIQRTGIDYVQLEQYIDASVREISIIQRLKSMRTAVIDDDMVSREIIKSFFEKYQVDNIEYHQNADEIMNRVPLHDMYLIDLVLPRYSGEEIISYIRKHNQKAIIIIVTTYGDGISIPHCLSIGADDFLLKPFNIKMFMLRISACISQKELYIENQNNSKKLFYLATRDALTSVYNRSFFIETFGKKLAEARRNKRAFSIVLVDLDHFKNINDEYGHLKGDVVLKAVAALLQKKLRKSDFLCRWGGEEFCILLSDTGLPDATIFSEKLRSSIEGLKIEGIPGVTASFGVTQWVEGDTDEIIFNRIDNSLYLAKLTGRNKVVSNEELHIYRGGLPATIEWGPFFRSGNREIDEDHNNLIVLSNEIIQYSFQDENYEYLLQLFERLLKEIAAHFEREETILSRCRYDRLESHKEIHSNLLSKSISMKQKLTDGKISKVELSKYLVQEVVVGHIIKHDFEFFEKIH